MQLVAYGAQDIYLTGSPQITFFKVVYRRHTNFSLESIEQTFNGSVNFGNKVTCTVSRNGDLLTKAYLKVTLPSLMSNDVKQGDAVASHPSGGAALHGWCDGVGHKLIKYVEVEIGGQRIDKHYGEWLQIWNELTQTAGHALGYNRMTGQHPMFQLPATKAVAAVGGDRFVVPEQTMYIPMQFWFNRNPGLALPLIALQYHEVKFNFEFETLDNLIPTYTPLPYQLTDALGGPETWTFRTEVIGQLQASLYVDYVYLDADERKRFAQVTHEYLIEQLQFTGAESIPSNATNHKAKLNFNHPVKELIWTVKPAGSTGGYHKMRPFNWSLPALGPNQRPEDATTPAQDDLDIVSISGMGAMAGAGGDWRALTSLQYNRRNPVKAGILQLNGHDRFSKRDGDYFNLVQPYQHHENVPVTGVNVYSFALKPEEHQPSGSCNMSRIDNAVLNLEFEKLEEGGNISVYATNYNVLRVLSGMGGLAYASIITDSSVIMDIAGIGSKLVSMLFTGFAHSFGR